jgi:hypothetical protein
VNATPVSIEGVRGGPTVRTLRRDLWWVQPLVTAVALTGFVAYGTWAAFRNGSYYAGPALDREYVSPFYSPCLASSCTYSTASVFGSWWSVSPALIVLIFPLGFRFTCYYYRKAYYRSFWLSPPACGVADGHTSYTGETRFPLILQNIHRYFFYVALVFAGFLTFDAVIAFRFPGGVGMGLGTIVLMINAALIWAYTVSCHACRHLCGGQINRFSEHPIRYRLWRLVTPLNAHHMAYAWLSLVWIAFADFYIWLVASGTIHDPRLF